MRLWIEKRREPKERMMTIAELVYLRENDVPVPGLYGPSADEM